MSNHLRVALLILTTLTMIGCDEDERLAAMAERHMARQAEQTRQNSQLHREVAAGSKRLVEADAKSRVEMVVLQREVQAERATVGRQRDALELQRQELAAQRRRDALTAAAISSAAWLLACLLPVAVCWLLLVQRPKPADAGAVADALLDDMIAEQPVLLPRIDQAPSRHTSRDARRLPGVTDPVSDHPH